jgi:type VI secretion system Hcp family effector
MADNVPDVYVKLHGLQGECTDEKHSGNDGWFQIKGFNFGFGLKNSGASGVSIPSIAASGGKPVTHSDVQNIIDKNAQKQNNPKKSRDKDNGPFDHPPVTLNKTFDSASPVIWEKKCHSGEVIEKIEVRACRYGGDTGDEKIPFLRLLFENVTVKSVSLSLSADEPPSESLQFTYDSVKMQYIWTANDTGSRVRGYSAPRAGWDFEHNKPVEWKPEDAPD